MRVKCHPSIVHRIPHCWKSLPVETRDFLPKRYVWRVHDEPERCADLYKLEDEEEERGPVRRELDRLLQEIQDAIEKHQKNRDLPFWRRA